MRKVRGAAVPLGSAPVRLDARELPQDLLAEGYRIQGEYLLARVSRALSRRADPPSSRHAIADQLEGIHSTVLGSLDERLPGRAGADLVRAQAGGWKSAWQASLSPTLSPFMDRPLSDAELAGLLQDIRDAARSFPPVHLAPADSADPERLASLGVDDLLSRVRDACYGATRACTSEYAPHEARTREWIARIEAANDHYLAIKGLPPADEESAASEKEKAQPAPAVASRTASDASPTAGTDVSPSSRPGAASPGTARRPWGLVGLAVLVLLIAGAAIRRSRAA